MEDIEDGRWMGDESTNTEDEFQISIILANSHIALERLIFYRIAINTTVAVPAGGFG